MKEITENKISTYTIGFLISVVLTCVAYFLTVNATSHFYFGPTLWVIAAVLIILAVAQFIVQLYFFLHLRITGGKKDERSATVFSWRFLVFLFMIFVVLVLVFGSLWIMISLNGRMGMTPVQVNQYMQDQAGL